MAKEFRQIVFTPKEIVRAVVDYRKWRKDALPEGRWVTFDMLTDPISVALAIQAQGDAPKTFHIPQDELASALILFCINAKVPIPAKSQKDVGYVGEQMALSITMNEHPLA